MPSNSSSICATDGGSMGRSPSNKSSVYNPVEQRNLAAYRISRYLSNPEHSHVQHRNASSQHVKAQINVMSSYLEVFDDTMKHAGNDTIRQAENCSN